MKTKIIFLFLFFNILLFSEINFRIMSYNSLRFPEASGEGRKVYFKKIFSYVHPDILIMQEVGSEVGADTLLAILNSYENKYERADFIDDGSMNSVLFYNQNFIQFIEVNQIYATPRKINEYILDVSGHQIRCYSCHLRASTGEQNEQERLTAVTNLRNYISQLPQGTEFVVVGDMNFYSSTEPAYQKFIADEENNIGRCLDLCPMIGDWHNNEDFSPVHTQSPRVEFFDGGIGGGLDDKFDFIFTSYDFNDGQNIEYIEDSFVTVGNDGNHFNQSINFGENFAVPPDIADALYYASDHLPVYADFSVQEDFLGLISPNGGENWASGETHQIVWETSLNQPEITITLIKANPYSEIILAGNVINSGGWEWNIAEDLPTGSDYKIKIETDGFSDISNGYFSINYTQPINTVFISEYVEGSSYNKALEIFNPCSYPIDLGEFTLKKQTNGSGDFSSDFALTGTLSSNDVIVIAHPSACEEILEIADYTDSGVCNFNGNDAIGLFKNGNLVDLLGVIDSDEYWGKDKTLVRKPYISLPSEIYIPEEWNEYPMDTFEYLGYHQYDPSNVNDDVISIQNDIKVYPNPFNPNTKSVLTFSFEKSYAQSIKISIYNLKGQCIKTKNLLPYTNKTEFYNLEIKTSGIYFYKFESGGFINFGKFVVIK